MEISPFKFPIRQGRATRTRAARALLFVGLSAFAVPACQHYEAGDSPQRDQSAHHVAAPAPVPPAVRAVLA